jgi:Holliday junction resolvase
MKEYLIIELKQKLDKDIKYKRTDIEKILNSIEQLNETQLLLYIKIRSKEKLKPNNIEKEYYEKKISLNK